MSRSQIELKFYRRKKRRKHGIQFHLLVDHCFTGSVGDFAVCNYLHKLRDIVDNDPFTSGWLEDVACRTLIAEGMIMKRVPQ